MAHVEITLRYPYGHFMGFYNAVMNGLGGLVGDFVEFVHLYEPEDTYPGYIIRSFAAPITMLNVPLVLNAAGVICAEDGPIDQWYETINAGAFSRLEIKVSRPGHADVSCIWRDTAVQNIFPVDDDDEEMEFEGLEEILGPDFDYLDPQ
jgi:hypothetical protein